MAEYIEREALIKDLTAGGTISDFGIYKIQHFHAADVAPVRHGHWFKEIGDEMLTANGFVHQNKYVCSCCGWSCCCEFKLRWHYCPNCGAKMDGD